MADRPTQRPRRALGEGESSPGAGQDETAPGSHFTEDEARPIFTEDAADADASTVRTAGRDVDVDLTTEAEDPALRSGRLSFTRRVAPPADPESTTLLPRTPAPVQLDALAVSDESDLDDERPHRFGRRTRLGLLVGGVAAVVVAGLAIGFAVVGGSSADTPLPTSTAASGPASPTAVELLDDASMLSATTAQPIDATRTWTVSSSVRGDTVDGPAPACLGSDPLEGAPTAQQKITQSLTSSGTKPPTALHVATAYASADDATQAFATTARALGTCAVPGDFLAAGRTVTGVGDQATAVLVSASSDDSAHWVVATRTGRVLDVVDAASTGKALDVTGVMTSAASVVAAQCTTSGGACATAVSTADGPPPAGGDEPGFLTSGDLPPAGSATAPWVGTPVEAPTEDFTGSQCETVSWTTTAATDRSSRVYLLQDVPGIFGLNEIVLTLKDADAAAKLVDKVRGDWTTCKERKLTATVASPNKVSGVGPDNVAVAGWTTVVEQKAGSTTTRFRVGIASAGNKVAFTFLNPQKGLDVSGENFDIVAVRAAQRATQEQ